MGSHSTEAVPSKTFPLRAQEAEAGCVDPSSPSSTQDTLWGLLKVRKSIWVQTSQSHYRYHLSEDVQLSRRHRQCASDRREPWVSRRRLAAPASISHPAGPRRAPTRASYGPGCLCAHSGDSVPELPPGSVPHGSQFYGHDLGSAGA